MNTFHRYGTKTDRLVNEYKLLYADVVKKTVEENDIWHIWLYSSPSNGNKTAQIINSNPQDNHFGDGKSNKYSTIVFSMFWSML